MIRTLTIDEVFGQFSQRLEHLLREVIQVDNDLRRIAGMDDAQIAAFAKVKEDLEVVRARLYERWADEVKDDEAKAEAEDKAYEEKILSVVLRPDEVRRLRALTRKDTGLPPIEVDANLIAVGLAYTKSAEGVEGFTAANKFGRQWLGGQS